MDEELCRSWSAGFNAVLDLGLISIASLGPRASTKVLLSAGKFSFQADIFCNVRHKKS